MALLSITLAQSQAARPEVPIPVSTDWTVTLLLTIVWIFVFAAVIGPLRRHFRGRPRG